MHMHSYCYIYVFLLTSMLCSVCSLPTGILRLPWLRFFRAFFSVVRQMPGYTSQRRGTVRTLPNYWTVLFYVLFVSIVLFYVLFVSIVLFYVLFVCKCVLYYCHRMTTQLQLNISYHIAILHAAMKGPWTPRGRGFDFHLNCPCYENGLRVHHSDNVADDSHATQYLSWWSTYASAGILKSSFTVNT